MLLHTVLLGITSVVSVAAAPASDPSDCGWKILFPYIPCVDVPDVPPHGSNETTSAQNCYQSAHTGACVYCGHWEGASALVSVPRTRILGDNPEGRSIPRPRRLGPTPDRKCMRS